MDKKNDGQQPATDDQELAQVLAGMNQQAADQTAVAAAPADGMQFEETGANTDTSDPTVAPIPDPIAVPEPVIEPIPEPVAVDMSVSPVPVPVSPELESIKKDALEQLRPLVDKLDLPAQEKFDTLLLIIRSTDDQSLLTAANETAKTIEDETKRAEALLDVIKEIDFFSGNTQPTS